MNSDLRKGLLNTFVRSNGIFRLTKVLRCLPARYASLRCSVFSLTNLFGGLEMKPMRVLSYAMLAFPTSTLVHGQIIQDFGIKVGAIFSNFRVTDVRQIVVGNQTFNIDFIQDDVVNPSISCFAD